MLDTITEFILLVIIIGINVSMVFMLDLYISSKSKYAKRIKIAQYTYIAIMLIFFKYIILFTIVNMYLTLFYIVWGTIDEMLCEYNKKNKNI